MPRIVALACLAIGLCAAVGAAEPQTVTVTIRGVVTDDDATALHEVLQNIDGIKVQGEKIERGERGSFGHFFSTPFEVELTDAEKVDLGAVAKVVAEAKTPSRRDVSPFLTLVVFDRRAVVGEDDIGLMRNSMRNVAGVNPDGSGTIGGVPTEGRYWVRIEGDGAARIADIASALRAASTEFRLQKQ